MVIQTNKARCRDCYRCVRTCPVKAVRVQESQAEIVADYCITCAACVRACPQMAKQVRDDMPLVRAFIAEGYRVIASVAPSAPAYFDVEEFAQMRAALEALGFAGASETALGAELVAAEHQRLLSEAAWRARPMIATACPVAVSFVEKYYPDLIENLAPVVSPMIAHARWLKAAGDPDVRVVFIGPCIAKKAEAFEAPVAGAVDAVLTFEDLEHWLADEGVSFPPPSRTKRPVEHRARLFPLGGGLLRTANLDTSVLSAETLAASGIDRCRGVLEAIRAGDIPAGLVELMACEEGCINGPAMPAEGSVYVRRERVIAFARGREAPEIDDGGIGLARTFSNKYVARPSISPEVLRETLIKMEKYSPEDELNCTACGYGSCREKAEAIYQGMAELGMCVPLMRRKAESLANVVIDATPNAIIVVDGALNIQDLSRRAEAMFNCRKAQMTGRPLSELLPTGTFEEVRNHRQPVLGRRVRYRDDLIVAESVVPVEGSSLIIGIIEDVTYEEERQAEMKRLRESTIEQAQEVINKQMRVAHEIASLLGETTAETKVQLSRLIKLMQEDGGAADR